MKHRLILADDHPVVRAGLRALLAHEPDLEIVGEASDGRAALELVERLAPDLAVLDVGMPNLNGIDTARRIRSASPATRVIALSMHAGTPFIRGMFEAGASAYVLKDSAFEDLIEAVRAVLAGSVYLGRGVTGVAAANYARRAPESGRPAGLSLTPREREILQLVAEGRSTKGIAELLGVSVKTVETHRQHIMQKLNIHSVAELTKYAIREGITPLVP